MINGCDDKLGFGGMADDAEVAFWTGILGEFPLEISPSYANNAHQCQHSS